MFKYQFDQNNWSLKFNGWMTQWRGFYTGGGDQGLFLKRTVFNSINGFDTSLDIMEDYDIFWRLKKAKYNYQIVKSPAIVSARKHLNNSTLKVNIVNLVTLIGFKVNGNAKSWSKFYARIIK